MSRMAEPETSADGGLSNDVLYDVLTDRRRRYALHFLMQQDGPVTVRELAEQVAAWENDKPAAQLDSQERKRVYISLYQSHLPSMDEKGLIDYDTDAKTVELADRLQNMDVYIEIVSERDVPWHVYYLGLSAANGLLVALAWLGVRPFDMLPHIAVGAIVVATFAVSALVQASVGSRKKFGETGAPPGVKND